MMDIRAFLSSGETIVHTQDPRSTLATSAKAVVASLILGASLGGIAPASANAAPQAENIAQMPYLPDARSALYQALVAPQDNVNLRVVSTRAASAQEFLSLLPGRFQQLMNYTPDNAQTLLGNSPSMDAATTSFMMRSRFYETQGVCLVNAADEVREHLTLMGGQEMFRHDFGIAAGSIYSDLAPMTADEATTIVTLHELAHCAVMYEASGLQLYKDPANQIEELANVSFSETLADLAVVLYYASQEGTFQNGILALTNLRANTGLSNHATLGNLERIVSGLDPKHFVGLPMHEIYREVADIGQEQVEHHHQEVVSTVLREFWETSYLFAKLTGNQSALQDLDGRTMRTLKEMAGPGFAVNPYQRASDLLNRVLDQGLRDPNRTRALGLITVQKVADIAEATGIVPTPEMIVKARHLDPAFTPPGSQVALGLSGYEKLKVVDYTGEIEYQAQQALNTEAKKVAMPSFR